MIFVLCHGVLCPLNRELAHLSPGRVQIAPIVATAKKPSGTKTMTMMSSIGTLGSAGESVSQTLKMP